MRHLVRCFLRSAITVLILPTYALAASSSGYIRGAADPGAQIILINLDTGAVMGIVAAADGTYRTDELAPGHYRIAEKGEYHAPREVAVVADKAANVDLSSSGSK